MPPRMNKVRFGLAGGRRWCAAGLLGMLPGLAQALQNNVVDTEQTAGQGAAPQRAASSSVGQAVSQRRVAAVFRADDARIQQTGQQGLLAHALPPELARHDDNAGKAAHAPDVPDERPLWSLLGANQLAAYDAQVAQLAREFPFWTPGRALVDERARRQRIEEFNAALKGGPGALRALLSRAPDDFRCDNIERVWRAADVFAGAGDADSVLTLYRTVIPACSPASNRIATLYRAEHQVCAAKVDELISSEAKEGHRSPAEDVAFERFRYQHTLDVLAALPPGDPAAAAQLAALAPAIRARRDGLAATQAGWIEFNQHELDAAEDWFSTALSFAPQSADATIGLAQVHTARHDWDVAEALLAGPQATDDARARDLRGQIALGRADDAYRHRHYDESVRQLNLAEGFGVSSERTAVMRGWSLYGLRNYAQAEQVFREHYEASHDEDSAEGLALTRAESGRHEEEDYGALGAYEHALDAQRLYYQKSFLAAHSALHDALAGPVEPTRITRYVPVDLQGIDAPSVSAGLDWSDHVGTAGEGRLNTVAPTVQAEWIDRTRQYDLSYRQLFLDSGLASLSQRMPGVFPLPCKGQIGCHGATTSVSLATAAANAFAAVPLGGSADAEELQVAIADTLKLGDDRALDWHASFGVTQGGAAGTSFDGQGSIGQQAKWGAWTVYAGVSPVRDSLMSWRGVTVPGSQITWGAVSRWASGAQAHWQILPRLNVSAGAQAQWLTGMNVEGNEGASVNLSEGYDFRVSGFDYFSAGPTLHYLTYRHNENFYTPGWGGYYSPQQSFSAGLALEVLSYEGRRLQWQGNFEAGWNESSQASEHCLPGLRLSVSSLENAGLANSAVAALTNATCYGSHDDGAYAHAQLSMTVRMSSRWQAGALVDINTTPGRDKQFGALAFLRYFFEPRAAVFSRDLPGSTSNFYPQLDSVQD